jgi:hypothetical protein
MLFFPLLLILTPSPTKSTQSILYALSAPVRVGPIKPVAPLQPIQPLQPGEKSTKEEVEVIDPRRSGVGGGDVVRDCAVVEYVSFFLLLPSSFFLLPSSFFLLPFPPLPFFLALAVYILHHRDQTLFPCPCRVKLITRLPPVLCDPLVARAHYDKIEKEVEEGVRQSQIREKASGNTKPQPEAGKE